MQKTLDLVEKL